MEFIPNNNTQHITTPKNLYPCQATICLGNLPEGKPRRSSFGSERDESTAGSTLARVISGGRRKSSFGDGTMNNGRRLSFGGAKESDKGESRWYWRVQAGVNETHLVLFPLTQPPNPLLTTPPPPLSTAIPSHSSRMAGTSSKESAVAEDNENQGFTSKVKNLFRRGSATTKGNIVSEVAPGSTSAAEESIGDQTDRGEMVAPKEANMEGATNVNSSAELGWPGVVHGEKLGAIIAPLSNVGKKPELSGKKKSEAWYVNVMINASTGQNEPIGTSRSDNSPQSGCIRFEFDKDWIGAKGEAELLHHYILQAAGNAPDNAKRGTPHTSIFKIGQHPNQQLATDARDTAVEPTGTTHQLSTSYGDTTTSTYPNTSASHEMAEGITPGQSVGNSSTGKIGEVY
ncbi:uncharacterized protein L203_105447 [Cryptococcus depauperatus CBS 7841]|uniref:Uncharacterized protein n=1 Tax=Cryptococcus depauperatus CBS 7841 TaxID=1295531 RepID=A0A1E3IF92_9TREE|nr:hypothetical protein L203_04123 [Cryptococcus depauperatus CBS 7841]